MTPQKFEPLKVYVLLSPFLVTALAFGIVWLTGWMDRREHKRRPAE